MIAHIPKTRAEIDAAFAEMANDPDYQAEACALEAEYAEAGWEALGIGERAYHGTRRPQHGA